LKLVSLKLDNEKIIGIITGLQKRGYRNGNLEIKYNYEYMEKEYNDRAIVSSGLLKSLYKIITFNNYHLGQKIDILINKDNKQTFPRKEINFEIFEKIFLLITFSGLMVILINIFFYKSKKRIKNIISKKKEKVMHYKYYEQDKNYKINEVIIGNDIGINDIIEKFDYAALKNDEIICCGIEKDGNFVELSYSSEYTLRVFNKGNETIKTINDNPEINEIIYKNIKQGNGA
jgi:hypothetical protein